MMQLSLPVLQSLVFGAIRIQTEGDWLTMSRFTQTQAAAFGDGGYFADRVLASAGMGLDFVTDSESLSLDVTIQQKSFQRHYSLDVYIDGKPEYHICKEDTPEDQVQLLFSMVPGEKRVTVYLDSLCQCKIKDLCLDPDSGCRPGPKGRKVLFLGDSITQGAIVRNAGSTWTNRIIREMDYDALNQGLCGIGFDSRLLNPELRKVFDPELIFVALGTNWDPQYDPEAFLKKLSSVWGDKKVYLLLPPIMLDLGTGRAAFLERRQKIACFGAGYPNITVIDTLPFLPGEEAFFADKCHPNDQGMELLANNIKQYIT